MQVIEKSAKIKNKQQHSKMNEFETMLNVDLLVYVLVEIM